MNFIGCSGYVYGDWVGSFYPKGLSKSKWFSYYAAQFNTVEVNYTFYHFPTGATMKRWYMQAPDTFRYSLKASRFITHVRKFKDSQAAIQRFYAVSDRLQEKLGCILFQVPSTLHYSPQKLKEVVRQLNPDYRNVLEFRHPSWWQMPADSFDQLSAKNILFCSVSAPGLPASVVKTTKEIYVRFHGRKSWYSSHYSRKELQGWARNLRHLHAKNNWVYFNNDFRGYAPKDAKVFKNCLRLSWFGQLQKSEM